MEPSMTRQVCLICVVLGLLLANSRAPAGEKSAVPFEGRVTATWDNIFDGLFDPPATFTGGGPVTHMGETEQEGTLVLGLPIEPGVYPGYGSVTITAANGDRLTFDYVGLLYADTGEGVGTFTFTGGTGRFADATGGGDFYALIDLSLSTEQPMSVILDGEIRY
jgi:hypothetical protein